MTHDETLAAAEPVDLLAMPGSGPLWGMASADLNATLLSWPPRHEVPEHVNGDLDVLVVVLTGRGNVMIDGRPHDLAAGSAILVPRGVRRRIVASDSGTDSWRCRLLARTWDLVLPRLERHHDVLAPALVGHPAGGHSRTS